ncbi:MAG: glucose 1-dehydrogenase [Rhodospirillales bacterium]|nr:glucose 1-dehydrogenase [Rhodospirillales bacterium]
MNLDGAVTIVTGSATGLGAAIAKQLAKKGCNVVINYTRSQKEAEETVRECEVLGVEALLCQGDVSKDEDCRSIVQQTIDKWGKVDALVNNAGTTKFAAAHDLEALSAEDFQQIYGVNVIGPYQMIRAVTPHMKEAGEGAIVNISSIAGVTGLGSSVAYSASKGALNTMTITLARALGPEIRINAICPGLIQSRWLQGGLGEERYQATIKNIEASTPLQAASTPDDIAESAVWMIEGARHVTGETLLVDAGLHLGFAPLVAR